MTQGHVDSNANPSEEASLRVLNRSLRSGFSRRMAFWDAVKQEPKGSDAKPKTDPEKGSNEPPVNN